MTKKKSEKYKNCIFNTLHSVFSLRYDEIESTLFYGWMIGMMPIWQTCVLNEIYQSLYREFRRYFANVAQGEAVKGMYKKIGLSFSNY